MAAQLGPQLKKALETAADEMVAAVRAIAPVSGLTPNPGDLRESVHKESGRGELAVRVVEDATDGKGNFIAPHVEYGHAAKDGSHVAALPHFWPSYNRLKKRRKGQFSRACSAAIKAGAAAATPPTA